MALTYESAGVNKQEGYKEVSLIKEFISRTYTKGVLSDLGGFSGLFELDKNNYEQPVLVSGTDGVGTKVKLAQMADIHNTVGIDCVAMCVNDILCQGAKPLFFLDYIATGNLIAEKMADIVKGIAEGCVQAGAALIGGETAEMPGIYKKADYDIAGFCVGVVDKAKIIDGKQSIEAGDIIFALPSSGVHSNGFSLIRKIIFEHKNFSLDYVIEETGKTIKEELLTPTKIYAKQILAVLETCRIKGLSHITGGGLYENVPRMLSGSVDAHINKNAIPPQHIFRCLQEWGEISEKEMYGTFNMGAGMIMVVDKNDADTIKKLFDEMGEPLYHAGEVRSGAGGVVIH